MDKEDFISIAMQLLQLFIETSDIDAVKETLLELNTPSDQVDNVLNIIHNMAKY